MSVRRLLTGLIIAAAATSARYSIADEKITEPHLGDAEPIGAILMEIPIVQAHSLSPHQSAALVRRLGNLAVIGSEIKSGSLINTASLLEECPDEVGPQLGQAVPLASLIQERHQPSAALNKSSGAIYQHLQKTVHLLDAIGLHDHSLTVEGILMEVESQLDGLESTHRDRVALAMKRAELSKLQAEITELANRIATDSEEPTVLPVNFDLPSPELLP